MCGSLIASHVTNTIKQLKKSINHTIETKIFMNSMMISNTYIYKTLSHPEKAIFSKKNYICLLVNC